MKKQLFFLILCIFKTYAMDTSNIVSNSNRVSNPKALIEAAGNLNVNEVTKLLKNPSINIEEKDQNGHTALFKAVKVSFFDSRYPTEEEKEKQVAIIKLLLKAKASPDVVDNRKRSLYSFAAMANWEHTLEALGFKTKKEALEKSSELVLELSNNVTLDDK